jgi:predicted GNAT family acetyltransferase
MNVNRDDVINNQAEQRYEVQIEGNVALIQYRRTGDTIYYLHTEVPPVLEGRGIAIAMARAALDDAAQHNLVVVPLCPFVAGYIRNHPEYQRLVHPDYRIDGA